MATARQPNLLPLHDFPQQQPPVAEAFRQPKRRADYLMLDLVGNVLEARPMSVGEARDTNLELEALDVPFAWVLADND